MSEFNWDAAGEVVRGVKLKPGRTYPPDTPQHVLYAICPECGQDHDPCADAVMHDPANYTSGVVPRSNKTA